MRQTAKIIILALLFVGLAFSAKAEEEYQLQYFLAKSLSKTNDLTKMERGELLNRTEEALERTQRSHVRLTTAILSGELEFRYQEGKYWMAKLEEGLRAIEAGTQQLKILKGKPDDIVASVILYKSLKDLAFNLNACYNVPSFASVVGDLAPELELWADPVFYQLYLLPLAQSKNVEVKPPEEVIPPEKVKPPEEVKPPKKEKKPTPKKK
jgi:hypothetical protein